MIKYRELNQFRYLLIGTLKPGKITKLFDLPCISNKEDNMMAINVPIKSTCSLWKRFDILDWLWKLIMLIRRLESEHIYNLVFSTLFIPRQPKRQDLLPTLGSLLLQVPSKVAVHQRLAYYSGLKHDVHILSASFYHLFFLIRAIPK